MFNPHKGQWWNAEDKREAHYGMTALEAWTYMKKVRSEYPGFIDDPMGTIRYAVSRYWPPKVR